ncbi:MAG TPA: cupin domain-containing protein [Candidatus Elarobacter sp.]
MTDEPRKISLSETFAAFEDRWSPKTLAAVGAFAVKAVKIDGPFVWHAHADDDELFYVLRGGITMEYRIGGEQRAVRFGPGEMLLRPRGVEHRPVADAGTEILLFEREDLVNTGDARVDVR